MPVFMFAAGTLLCVVGLFLIGFFIPNRDFSVGGTFILAGAVAIVGGVLSLGLGGAIRELRKLTMNLDKAVPVARTAAPARPAPQAPPQRPPAPTKPVVVNTQRSQRAEPRLDAPSPDLAPLEPPAPAAPTIADVTAGQPRGGLFASIRGRAAVQAAMESAQPSGAQAPQQPPRAAEPEAPEVEPEPQPADDRQPQARTSSLSALAARTAARLDLPRPVPDLPRVTPERHGGEPAAFDRASEPAIDRPSRNVFDTVWPTDAKSPVEHGSDYGRKKSPGIGAERHADIAPMTPAPEPRQVEILKSGVIDGMAYTLYTDGSIEAQLPQGTLRFTSIDDLRAHLERG